MSEKKEKKKIWTYVDHIILGVIVSLHDLC